MAKKAKRSSRARKGDKLRAYYIASTHWDREWYEPFQHYRFRLVDLLDRLLDLMERDPRYKGFQLDGQTIILEDYLEIRPEQRPRVQALYDAGRLEAGPWYCMPDEFLPCGESLVRNLARGHRVAAEFGEPMKCGFVCDTFGHISQLPQIFNGFGIDTAVVWRGTNFPKHPGVFRWQSPDGSECLSYTFFSTGYGQYWGGVRDHGMNPDFTLDLTKALAGMKAVVETERERVPGEAVVLFDGLDHMFAEPQTPDLLERARKRGINVEHARWDDFFADVRGQKLKLKLFVGELRDPGDGRGMNVIPGVASSRIHLKQANARCEALLLNWAEPFAAFATLLGHPYPRTYLELAWRYLLTNHPHDSICGCSIDQVHQDMIYRFDQSRMIAERSSQMSRRAIADRTALPKLDDDEDYAITVFNPTGRPIDEIVDIPLVFGRDTPHRFQEWFGYEKIIGFRLYDEKGKERDYQRLDVTKAWPLKTYDHLAGYHGEKYERVNVALPLKIPPYGWTTLLCKPTKDRTRSAGTQLVDDHTAENPQLRVSINPNGTLDLHDRQTGATYRNLLTFEERADIGDGWYHGTAVNDAWFTSHGSAADIALVYDGFAQTTFRIRIVMNVPTHFQRDERIMQRAETLAPLVITSWVTLKADARALEVRTEVDNTVRDHRLRVLFPTDLAVDTYFTDSAFDVIERPVALEPGYHKRRELELETKPQASWTAVSDGRRGLAVVSTGQPESGVRDLPTRPIALTLFRGFYRTVAQENEEGGQVLGTRTHVYRIVPFSGRPDTRELCELGQLVGAGLACEYTEQRRRPFLRQRAVLPATGSLLTSGRGPLVVTACKLAEDGEGLIVRLFNPSDARATQRLTFASPVKRAERVNLLETVEQTLRAGGRSLSVTAGPREIVTVRVVLAAVGTR